MGKNLSLKPTISIYREAVGFIVDIINKEWDSLEGNMFMTDALSLI